MVQYDGCVRTSCPPPWVECDARRECKACEAYIAIPRSPWRESADTMPPRSVGSDLQYSARARKTEAYCGGRTLAEIHRHFCLSRRISRSSLANTGERAQPVLESCVGSYFWISERFCKKHMYQNANEEPGRLEKQCAIDKATRKPQD